MNPEQILQELAGRYARHPEQITPLEINIELLDRHEIFAIRSMIPGEVTLESTPVDAPDFTVTLDFDTLAALWNGRLSPLTAAAREHLSAAAPLDFRLPAGKPPSAEMLQRVIDFTRRFFNPTVPERVTFGLEQSRPIHGGHAVALFYDRHFRSAWYGLLAGEQLNEAGDTNPFPQAWITFTGTGRAEIGEASFVLHPGDAVHVPPNTSHVIRNDGDELLSGIWLAWGERA